MKQFFKKILAVSMTFVLLFSTMSFSISEHYCGDMLVASAIFSKVESCGMEMQKQSQDEDCSFQSEDCCNEIIKQIEGQNELKSNFSKLNFEQQQFITSFAYSYINLFEGLDTNIIPFKNYSPPLIVTDIQVLDQVFLI